MAIFDGRGSALLFFLGTQSVNYFLYLMNDADYSTEEIPDTTPVVNPEYRRLDGPGTKPSRSPHTQAGRLLGAESQSRD